MTLSSKPATIAAAAALAACAYAWHLRKRLQRLIANMQENLVMFGLVVLIAHTVGVSNDQTALGASLFFYARVAHAVVYAFGWPWIRPLCWFVSFVGLAMIVLQIFLVI